MMFLFLFYKTIGSDKGFCLVSCDDMLLLICGSGVGCVCRYFTALQKELEPYDSILYEMVASKETLQNRRNPIAAKRLKTSRSRGFSILGFIQRQMARVLALDFQLDCLDYEAKNWYHADLDFETFTLLQVCFFKTISRNPPVIFLISIGADSYVVTEGERGKLLLICKGHDY